MELIDKKKLIKQIQDMKNELAKNRGGHQYLRDWEISCYNVLESTERMIDGEPVVEDVAPVKHGHWTEITYYDCANVGRCSCCGEFLYVDNFCANCGAKME